MTPRRSKRLAEEIANTRFERILGNASQLSLVLIGGFVILVALHLGQVILAPLFLAIVVGLMFGPIADLLERRGIPDAVSAAIVVLGFLCIIAASLLAFAAPFSEWAARMPAIWQRLQAELANWQEPLAAVGALQEQVQGALGSDTAMAVTVEDGGPVTEIAFLAPAVLAQVLIFLASLYFFLATRDNIRVSILALCTTRRLRWRMAHVFRDVEAKVSRYLMTISLVNIGVGLVVTLMTWAIGLPTPLLWGALAALLNYIPFVGQAVMALILFVVGLASGPDLAWALLPVVLYWIVNFIEGNFVTPNLLGRTMTVNPFLIFLSLAYWLWAWGPVGGLVAVPSLLVLHSIATHVLPMDGTMARRPERPPARAAAAPQQVADTPAAKPARPSRKPAPVK